MLHCLNLLPLSVRCSYLKLITMFNIVNGHFLSHLVFFNDHKFQVQKYLEKARVTSSDYAGYI